MSMLGTAAQMGMLPLPLSDGSTAPISNEDIGRVVAGVLANPTPYAGRTLRPTRPEILTRKTWPRCSETCSVVR